MANDLSNYKKYLVEKYPSKDTFSVYYPTVKKFLAEFPFTREGVQQYIQQLKDFGRSSSTINNKLSALKNYNKYLLETEQTQNLIILERDYIKKQNKTTSPNTLSVDKVERILDKIKNTDSQRNYTIIYLLISTGIRRTECANILLSNLNLNKGELIVVGKGNKERTIYLNDKIIIELKKYLNSGERKEESKYLFTTKKSLHMARETINRIVDQYKINTTPHKFRHFYGSYGIHNGMDIQEVKDQLGHASLNTTTMYLKTDEKSLKKKINKISI